MYKKLLSVGLILTSSQLFAADYDFKPGLWQTTMTTEVLEIDAPPHIVNMMSKLPPPPTETECITDINTIFDPEPDDAQDCKTTTTRVSSKKMNFETKCLAEDGSSNGVGEIHFSGSTITSSIIMTTIGGPMTLKMRILGEGKYIGACK